MGHQGGTFHQHRRVRGRAGPRGPHAKGLVLHGGLCGARPAAPHAAERGLNHEADQGRAEGRRSAQSGPLEGTCHPSSPSAHPAHARQEGCTTLLWCERAAERPLLLTSLVPPSAAQASELLFGDAWLFRAPRNTDTVELLAMLGQPDTRGAELSVANWDCPEACARELAVPLRCSPATLLSSSETESGEDGASDESGSLEEGLLWARASTAMQVCALKWLAVSARDPSFVLHACLLAMRMHVFRCPCVFPTPNVFRRRRLRCRLSWRTSCSSFVATIHESRRAMARVPWQAWGWPCWAGWWGAWRTRILRPR